jgi:hypothetical protein
VDERSSQDNRRYLNEMALNKLPEAAVPELDPVWASSLPKLAEPANENGVISSGRSRDRTCDFDRVKACRGSTTSSIAPHCAIQGREDADHDPRCFTLRRSDSSPFVTDDAVAADAALAAYLKVRADQLAARLALGWTPPGAPS